MQNNSSFKPSEASLAMFQNRGQKLEKLREIVTNGSEKVISISGILGIGKTQFSSEFVHRYGSYFRGGVYWLSFSNQEIIPTEVAACGSSGILELRPDFEELGLEEQIRLVLQAWQEPIPRLVVFDGCEDFL